MEKSRIVIYYADQRERKKERKNKRSKMGASLPRDPFKIHKIPGLTKTSYHTISIYEKLLAIQFHTIPYVQKIV